MSRTAEEQLLLEERIQAMKRKNEELRRRHMEVEADKQSAAKQNALVKMNVPHDDDWVPGRVVDNPRQDRPQQDNDPSSPSAQDRSDERSQWPDQRRNRQFEEGSPHPKHNSQNFSGRRDYQGNRQRSDGDWSSGNENRRSGDWPNRSNDGGRPREWGTQGSRGYRNSAASGSGDGSKNYPTTFTSKVFKNSSMDPDRGKRPGYRLAEGDGPPPDPSYSFLGDSMRDSPESGGGDKRRGAPKRGFPRSRGRGGQSWNHRGFHDSANGDFEDRTETQPRNQDDPKQDAWRRERSKIDQERINRQKTSDGNWSREWDNNKVLQEGSDRPHRWRRGNQNQNYGYSQPRRGFHDNSNNGPNQSYGPRGDTSTVVEKADGTDSSPRPPFGRRGRFTHQQRFKDNTRFSNGSAQQAIPNEPNISKEASDAALIESNVTSVEKLQVSLVSDASSGQMRRSVEGQGGSLRVSKDDESSDSKTVDQKRQHKRVKKGKRNRVFSSTSTGTTGTAEDDNQSWEDLSSDEEAVSVLAELEKVPRSDMAKCVDVSSGPESLDPVPAPGKEDEFLWDDFHPAGFQDNENVTLHLTAEAAYQALLDGKAKEIAAGAECPDGEANISPQPPQVSFRLDTACLEDSGDELEGAKLDPLLVTTQIVQAEVDCMSLSSLPPDTSLPEEVSQFIKTIREEDGNKVTEAEGVVKQTGDVSAEELSGPVSILDVPQKEKPANELCLADKLRMEEAGSIQHVSEKSEEGVPHSGAASMSELEADANLREQDLEQEPEKKDDFKQDVGEKEDPQEKKNDLKQEPETKDKAQEVEEKEGPNAVLEKTENVQDPILAGVPAGIESSKETAVSELTTKMESEECVKEASALMNDVENVSENRSNTVSDNKENGDASDIANKSSIVSDEATLSAKEKSESNKSSSPINSSEKVPVGQECDSQDVKSEESVEQNTSS